MFFVPLGQVTDAKIDRTVTVTNDKLKKLDDQNIKSVAEGVVISKAR